MIYNIIILQIEENRIKDLTSNIRRKKEKKGEEEERKRKKEK